MTQTVPPVAYEDKDYEGGSYRFFVVDGELAMRIRFALGVEEDDTEVVVREHLRSVRPDSTEFLFSDLQVSCDGAHKEFIDPDSYGSGWDSVNSFVRLLAWLDAEAPL